jgi:hypothetical protein
LLSELHPGCARARALRPHCEACEGVKARATIEIEHLPGEELQWDWDELPEAPWGGDGHLLVGSLPFSGKFRAVFADAEDQAHLIEAMDGVLRRLGGTARRWRLDRMATVVDPRSGVIQASFVPVAKHYRVSVVACPPRRGNRKGSVEKSIHYATQRFWRTMSATNQAAAQTALDGFCVRIGDRRPRPVSRLTQVLGAEGGAQMLVELGRSRPTVGDLAALEPLAALPAAVYPATITSAPVSVGPSALAAFEGNAYSVPSGFIGASVTVTHRLGSEEVRVVSGAGTIIARHRRETPGAGAVVRTAEHRSELEHQVLAAFSAAPPCRRKANRPPSTAARAEAARLAGIGGGEVVVDLAVYQAVVDTMGSGLRPA